jgi:transcriptional regulator with XRE-family HTH domain
MESAANFRSDTGARIRHVRGDLTQDRFAAQYGLSVATVRNYESNVRPPAPDFLAALAIEGWSINWLLTGAGSERVDASHSSAEPRAFDGPRSQDLSVEHLSIAIELADEVLDGLWLPRRGYAELVALVYEALTQGLPYARVMELARPAAKQRAGEGTDDDGGKGLDRPGAGGIGGNQAG